MARIRGEVEEDEYKPPREMSKKERKEFKAKQDAKAREARIARREKERRKQGEFTTFEGKKEFPGGIRFPRHKKGGKRCAINLRDVPVVLRDQFRATCMDRGETMRDALIRLMAEQVRNRFDVIPYDGTIPNDTT